MKTLKDPCSLQTGAARRRRLAARAVAALAAAPCWAFAAHASTTASALHLPGLSAGLSSGLGTLFRWLFGG